MMADFLAHAAYMTARGDMPAVPNEQPFLEREPPQLPPGQSGVTNLRYGPGALSDLKIALAEKLKAKGASANVPFLRGNLLERAFQRRIIGVRADFLGGFDEPLRLLGIVRLCRFAWH